MAEEIETVPAPVEEPPVEQPPVVDPPSEDDGEPGGASPQEVRARKEYRARKKIETEARALREQNLRLEERLKTLEEVKQSAPKEKIYTLAEVNALVTQGQLERKIADDYIEQVIWPAKAKALLDADKQEAAKQQPIVSARAAIAEYVKYVPALTDSTSEAYQKAASEFADLTAQGYPDNDLTRRLALKIAHGDLEMLKRKAEVRNMNSQPRTMPVDGGGGSNGSGSAQPKDISRAPAHLQEYWQKAGLNPKERESHFKKWQSQQATKK